MRMRKVLMSLAVVLLAGCASASTSGRPVAYERQEPGAFLNFVGNWDDTKHPVLYAVIRTPEDYDRIYHPAGVMGADRPYAPKPEFFRKSQILLVCRLVPKLSQKPSSSRSCNSRATMSRSRQCQRTAHCRQAHPDSKNAVLLRAFRSGYLKTAYIATSA